MKRCIFFLLVAAATNAEACQLDCSALYHGNATGFSFCMQNTQDCMRDHGASQEQIMKFIQINEAAWNGGTQPEPQQPMQLHNAPSGSRCEPDGDGGFTCHNF